MTDWLRSRKNNMYCTINGAQVTIFPAREGGVKAVIASPDGRYKVYTRAFQEEIDCAAYIKKHFYNLIKDWGLSPVSPTDANPFAGIKWDDDDVPF